MKSAQIKHRGNKVPHQQANEFGPALSLGVLLFCEAGIGFLAPADEIDYLAPVDQQQGDGCHACD